MYDLSEIANALTVYNTMRMQMDFTTVTSVMNTSDRELLIDILADLMLIKDRAVEVKWWEQDSMWEREPKREWAWVQPESASDC